jgi:hypothetical protein
MRQRRVLVGVLAFTASGGGDDGRAATRTDAAAPKTTPTPTATATATATPTAHARSVRECAQLWNADALPPENYQVKANDFVAEVAPVRVRVAFGGGTASS